MLHRNIERHMYNEFDSLYDFYNLIFFGVGVGKWMGYVCYVM